MHGQHAAEIVAVVQDDGRPRLPAETVELGCHLLGLKAERQFDVVDAERAQRTQVALEQGDALKAQQALRKLLLRRLLQAQAEARGENDGSHLVLLAKTETLRRTGRINR